MAKGNHSFTEQDIRKRFGAIVGHTVAEDYRGARRVLGDVLVAESDVPEQFYIAAEKLPDWRYLKGAKREERTNKKTGFTYTYSEGAMSFPDSIDKPSRTILTGEGGTGASRFKHVIEYPDGPSRRNLWTIWRRRLSRRSKKKRGITLRASMKRRFRSR